MAPPHHPTVGRSLPARQRQVVLVARPNGIPQAEHFALVEADVRPPAPGELVVRNEFLSVDPGMRGWVSDAANYAEPVPLGGVMRAFAVGTVVASEHPDHRPGERVTGSFGWQEFATVSADTVLLRVDEEGLSPSLSLGVLGLTGVTAWIGVRHVLRPVPGETVVVSTAAGAVGSVAGQLARQAGCRAVGITGGAAKVRICLNEFGFDAAVDYRSPTFAADLAAAAPEGVDAYFDNTSGPVSDAVLPLLNVRARVAVCGTAAVPSWDPWPGGPRVERHLLTRRARMEGFLFFDHQARLPEAVAELAELVRGGRLHHREDVLEGLAAAPDAIAGLYRGENLGKRVIRLP